MLGVNDFDEQNGTITFADGDDEETFTLNVKNDSETDGYKTVDLYLKNPTGGAVTGLKQVVLTIIDDELTENNAGKFSFTEDDVEIDEDEGTYYAYIKRTSGATGTASVDYATEEGSASEYSDYTPTNGTLTFVEGEALKRIPIKIIADDDEELTESFTIKLTNATNDAVIINPNVSVYYDRLEKRFRNTKSGFSPLFFIT